MARAASRVEKSALSPLISRCVKGDTILSLTFSSRSAKSARVRRSDRPTVGFPSTRAFSRVRHNAESTTRQGPRTLQDRPLRRLEQHRRLQLRPKVPVRPRFLAKQAHAHLTTRLKPPPASLLTASKTRGSRMQNFRDCPDTQAPCCGRNRSCRRRCN